MVSPLVSTDWLAERLGHADIQVIDASWFLPMESRNGGQEYLEGHIPGAIFFDIDALSDEGQDLPHMLPTPEAFAVAAGKLGLSPASTQVVYDTVGIRSSARVWWNLRAMGFEKVFVLDGGMKAWRAAGLPEETGLVSLTATTLQPHFAADLVADISDVRKALSTGSEQVVDARAAARFSGDAPEPRPGVKPGHMPGALNLPFDRLLTPEGRMKAPEDLTQTFETAGVDLDRPIITTCGSGVTASVIALALERLGRSGVAVYDGSWSEWGGRPDTEIATGA